MPDGWITKYVSAIAESAREGWEPDKGLWKDSTSCNATQMIEYLFKDRQTIPLAEGTDFSPLIASVINASKTEDCRSEL